MQKTTRPTTCIKLQGELDHHNAPAIRRQLDHTIDHCRGILVLDLSEVTLMDSSGIGLLIGRYKRMKERGGSLCVCNVNPQIDKLLRMSGMYSLVEKYEVRGN